MELTSCTRSIGEIERPARRKRTKENERSPVELESNAKLSSPKASLIELSQSRGHRSRNVFPMNSESLREKEIVLRELRSEGERTRREEE